MIKSTRAALLVLGLLLALLAPAASAQSESEALLSTPETLQVHQVDASGALVELVVLSSTYQASASDVSVIENGVEVGVAAVTTATASNKPHDLIFVVDTSNRLVQGEVFSKIRAALASEIEKLPSNVQVGVIAAGELGRVQSGLSYDHASVARDVAAMGNSSSSSLFDSIERAASMLDNDPARLRTVVVIAGGPDTSSTSTMAAARGRLVQLGAQLVSVSFDGGDPALDIIPLTTGCYVVQTSVDAQIGPAIANATAVARDRLIISYKGESAANRTIRGDVTVTVGAMSTQLSHAGGVFEDHLVALTPVLAVESTGLAFFRTTLGLYTAVGLSFVAAALLVWALGNLFAAGDTSLESMLNRYAQGGDAALDEEESNIVQTALVKKAVQLSETFAEDKGFLIKIEGSLERARLPLRAGEAMGIYAAVVLLAAILGLLLSGSIIGALITALIFGFFQVFAVRFMARKRMKAFEKQLPDTLQLLAGTLRAGYSLPQGLEAVSKEISDPMGYELTRVMTEARLGRELEDALNSTAERLESDDFAWAVMAISIQREVGGNLNELLMTVSDTMVARERLHGEVAALTAEGKLSAAILGGLPPALGMVMYVMNPAYISPLFTTTIGKALIGVALTLMLIGMGWMKKVITINV